MTTEPATVIQVGMGQYALARGPAVLKATLGSCIGIALVWRAQGLCALAHCLLPTAPPSCTEPGARYVDQALRTLLAELQVPRSQRHQLEAHLGGGAQMAAGGLPKEAHLQVGRRNIEAAHQALACAQLAISSQDLGGRCARRMLVDAVDGRVSVVLVAGC